ncbi:hypothetical protein [Acidocella sp. KAb 2-4]|uniref:hypothetical protein n=1 Tax=Acidocella sp. KAb 2-4 TaxID=2885158 RepID=UPI001D0615A6|nr:hypothetical protein [Acidocella sp. KAb 2-4]MCB5943830.1 hypothetical protein [Acidocella sp. KAb 2-4]
MVAAPASASPAIISSENTIFTNLNASNIKNQHSSHVQQFYSFHEVPKNLEIIIDTWTNYADKRLNIGAVR